MSPTPKEPDDLDRYLPAIAAGDKTAFAAWMAGAVPTLHRRLRSFAEWVDTEAVLQAALLKTWDIAPRITPDGRRNSLLRWAAWRVRLDALSSLRARPLEQLDDEPVDGSVEPEPPDPLLRALIERCFADLPEGRRRVLEARLLTHGCVPDRDLAVSLGLQLNTFHQTMKRARESLQRCLEQRGYQWEGR
jgi:RNA polymerase sigma factor (sigma-70 family)